MVCPNCGLQAPANARFCAQCATLIPASLPAFANAEAEYARLHAEYDRGSISPEQFKAAVEAGVVEHDGAYWMLGVASGKWYRHDGAAWCEAHPPTALPTTAMRSPPPSETPAMLPTLAATPPPAPHTRSRTGLALAGLTLVVIAVLLTGAFAGFGPLAGLRQVAVSLLAGSDPLLDKLLANGTLERELAGWRLYSPYAFGGEHQPGEAGAVVASLNGQGANADLHVTVFVDRQQAQRSYDETTAELLQVQREISGAAMQVTLSGQTGWCTGDATRMTSCRVLVKRCVVFVLFREPVSIASGTPLMRALDDLVDGLE